ncbi:cation diffusion facilitator family transporter [Polymorphobacter fuscus]|uniref:Cation diffusion facilitator family transporter n=1 Tax=Sandarakinorhabdus fusca TaxID=1439888 RepID=A0A7C9GR91_9SPHN|nr:cation diffusion facilitator family transporter [Polymorphobacter fuscus]KAB7647680.1 cation transporter [Polymorphobacter fuscus]MQT16971.1 cation diffusion facilitator family transporter [Polymorphobacter fuscus]NJC09039.1 cobalt-zinc-cadmium efflux system protein [Polymorphobacter fuscus]
MAGHHHDHKAHGGHDHGGHGHSHAPASFGRAFAIGIGINLAYVAMEALAGVVTGSMALLADAGHNLSDVLGLAVAWAGLRLALRPPSARFTYGLKRSGILAALLNAVLLCVACGAIAVEALRRLQDPQPVAGDVVMIVAGIGIVVNGFTAWLFARGKDGDVNIRGAYLHMLADAGVSAAVVVSGFVILKTGLNWIDPALSLIVVAVILRGTWGLLRESVAMALDAVPEGIDSTAVADFLKGRPGVVTVHDLHIWPMGTTDTALTAHLVMPAGHPGDAALADLAHDLEHKFGIGHATIQVETGAADCGRMACA